MLMFSIFKTLTDQRVVVELKNDLAIEGVLKSVDQFLNIKLESIRVIDPSQHPHMAAVKNVFIRGSVVRYVQIPKEAVDTQLLEDATRRGRTVDPTALVCPPKTQFMSYNLNLYSYYKSHRPPQSAASTSTSSYGQPASPSFAAASAEPSEVDLSLPSDLSESDEEDQDMRESDSLFQAPIDEVAGRATAFLYGDFAVVDKPDLLSSPLFKRPPMGTEIDKDIAEMMEPRFQALVKHIDDTEWMFPTPRSFLPKGVPSTMPSSDLPILATQSSQSWHDRAMHIPARHFDPLAELDGDKYQVELEMSFVESAGQNTYGLANGQLARDVSLLGV